MDEKIQKEPPHITQTVPLSHDHVSLPEYR